MKNFRMGLLAITLTAASCTAPSTTSNQPASLPPVRAILNRGVFVVPGCPEFDRKLPKHLPVMTIPTAQEAILAGYRASPACKDSSAERLRIEKDRLGELPVSEKTENWKAQLYLAKELDDVDRSQSDTEQKQRDLEDQIEEVDATKVDK